MIFVVGYLMVGLILVAAAFYILMTMPKQDRPMRGAK